MLMRHSRPLSKHKKWVVTEILKKERVYDHDNVGKNATIMDAGDVRKSLSLGEQEMDSMKEKEVAAATAAATTDAEGVEGGGSGAAGVGTGAVDAGAVDNNSGVVVEDLLEAPALGAAPQVIGVPTKPKYASFRGFAAAIWGF